MTWRIIAVAWIIKQAVIINAHESFVIRARGRDDRVQQIKASGVIIVPFVEAIDTLLIAGLEGLVLASRNETNPMGKITDVILRGRMMEN